MACCYYHHVPSPTSYMCRGSHYKGTDGYHRGMKRQRSQIFGCGSNQVICIGKNSTLALSARLN